MSKLLDEVASEIGEGIHTGLRKWSEHSSSSIAHQAISEIDDGSWENIVKEVAKEVIKLVKKSLK